jgi:hypothetical protein
MATQKMLQQRNSYERVNEMQVNRLTVYDGLTSLESNKARRRRPGAAGWLAGVLILVVAGCASMPGGELTRDSPQEAKTAVLTQRINARWDALIRGDLDQAYTFMSQASKDAYPLDVYKAKVKPGMWRSVRIEGIECEAEICRASLVLTYDHRVMKGVTTPLLEVWTIDRGNAWFVYQPLG